MLGGQRWRAYQLDRGRLDARRPHGLQAAVEEGEHVVLAAPHEPAHPLGKPSVSLAEACEAQQREADEARKQLIEKFWEIKERG